MARSLLPGEFTHCLGFVGEALSDSFSGISPLPIVRLGSVLLHGAPEGKISSLSHVNKHYKLAIGTLKIVQFHFTRWLQIFADRDVFTADRLVRLQVLAFINKQCSDRVCMAIICYH
jgi:hypothetical protein